MQGSDRKREKGARNNEENEENEENVKKHERSTKEA
jgi:hypothetical protein